MILHQPVWQFYIQKKISPTKGQDRVLLCLFVCFLTLQENRNTHFQEVPWKTGKKSQNKEKYDLVVAVFYTA